jgi:hypothetical protein
MQSEDNKPLALTMNQMNPVHNFTPRFNYQGNELHIFLIEIFGSVRFEFHCNNLSLRIQNVTGSNLRRDSSWFSLVLQGKCRDSALNYTTSFVSHPFQLAGRSHAIIRCYIVLITVPLIRCRSNILTEPLPSNSRIHRHLD